MVLIYIILGIIGLSVLYLFITHGLLPHIPRTCDICGRKAGAPGNRHFKLSNGYMCTSCAEKFSRDGDVSGLGPCAFDTFSVGDVIRKGKMTQEEWDEEQRKKNATPPEEMAKIQAHMREIEKQKKEGYSIKCPKCGCTTITSEKTGFAVGKALGATMVFGDTAGYIAGTTGSNKIQMTCLGCGHRWIIKK